MSAKPDYSERRILIVDDEEFMRSLVTRVLKQLNVSKILSASDGASAVRTLASEGVPVDCILCDFNMEPINGLQLLKAIRTGKANTIPRDQKFIMLTGHADKDIVGIALQLGVNGYVVKPVPSDKLAAALEHAFNTPISLASVEQYKAVSLGEAEKVPPKEKARSLASVVWDRKKINDAGLEAKLNAIRSAGSATGKQEDLTFINVSTCWVKDMKADMMLAEDIEIEGVLLVAAGTVLNENLITKLKEIVAGVDSMPFVKIGELA